MTTLYVDNIAPNLQSKISAPNLDVPIAAGEVVQMKQAGDTVIRTTTSSSWTDTGLSVSLTPKYTDSLIIIQANLAGEVYGSANMGIGYALYRDSSQIYNNNYDIYNSSNNAQRIEKVTLFDAEISNSLTTRSYSVYFRAMGSGTARHNQYGAPSRLFVWEIKQ